VTARAPTPLDPFDVAEADDVPFRFGGQMIAGETITSVDVECRSVGSVVDPTPEQVIATPYQVQGTDVVQRISRSLEGARYIVRVRATMSSGRVFVGAAHVAIVRL
jgi:hypothetical protein